jgi:hypothetical protein
MEAMKRDSVFGLESDGLTLRRHRLAAPDLASLTRACASTALRWLGAAFWDPNPRVQSDAEDTKFPCRSKRMGRLARDNSTLRRRLLRAIVKRCCGIESGPRPRDRLCEWIPASPRLENGGDLNVRVRAPEPQWRRFPIDMSRETHMIAPFRRVSLRYEFLGGQRNQAATYCESQPGSLAQ